MSNSIRKSDFLVIGSGIAGLTYALDVAQHGSVTVICKSNPLEGSTQYAQGGIATVTDPLDSFAAHVRDTIDAGAGLCKQDIVEMVVEEGPARIAELISRGARFDTATGESTYSLAREGGHSARRILHAGDATGAEIQRAIIEAATEHPAITIVPHQIAIDFITPAAGEVLGAYALDRPSGEVFSYCARTTMLASGGAGKVYLYTSNPAVATGDGIAMAYRAGAPILNMEFVQFHPTCLFHQQANHFLISEAVRGEGGILKNLAGEAFMHHYDERKELAPRDIVARAIDDQMKRTGADYVLLDISHLDADFLKNRFPTIYARTSELGFDITKGAIPVVPAAHYSCGGVASDQNGKTALHRLYVAGETACTGLHGANRLASNSLLEALVFAHRAAVHTLDSLGKYPPLTSFPVWDYLKTVRSSEQVLVSHAWDEVRRTMWNLVGIVRNDKRLRLASERISRIKSEIRDYYWQFQVTSDLIELRNIIDVAQIIIESAMQRKESRGLHFTVDYPELAPEAIDTVVQMERQ